MSDHYNFSSIECKDAIRAQLSREEFIGWLRGNIAKYNWRLMHKGAPSEDAHKLADYANWLAQVVREGE